jgi:hypothetical protein
MMTIITTITTIRLSMMIIRITTMIGTPIIRKLRWET